MWYTDGFRYDWYNPNPYDGETIDRLVYDIEKAIVDKYFTDRKN